MRETELPQIRNLELFSTMSTENFERLMKSAYLKVFPAQLELISEGDPADFLHIVIDGCVELFAKGNYREASMGMVYPVGTFILAAVLKDAVYLMSARTYKKSKILMIPSENVRAAYANDDSFSRSLVVELASCYRNVVKAHKDLKLRTAVERLANRLLKYNRDQGETGFISIGVEKKTLASLMGMTPENLSRAFNTLKPYGVNVNGSTIELTDIKSLEVLAKPNHLIDDRDI